MALIKVKTGGVDSTAPLGRRNLIINGAMQVAQRGASVTVGGAGGSGYKSVDRFSVFNPIDLISEQSSDSPDGFTYSHKVTKNTATATNTTSIGCFRYGVELQDIYHLAYGTSSAKTTTLSFYVKSSHTGTYNVLALNHGGSTQRQLTKLYTVNSANTWEYKTLTFEADSAFAGHTDTANSMGISLDFICTPSGAWSGGTVNTNGWQDNVNADRISTNQANALQSNGDSFAITGVQLEVGSVATPFEHRSYGEELALCQRYFQKIEAPHEVNFLRLFANRHLFNIPLVTTMRAAPTANTPTLNTGRYGAGGFLNGATISYNASFHTPTNVAWDVSDDEAYSGAVTLSTDVDADAEL